MSMNINLTPQLEELVREKVNSGFYNSASEVVRETLRLMAEQDRLKAARLEELRRDIRTSLDSGDSTAWDPEQVKLYLPINDGIDVVRVLHSAHDVPAIFHESPRVQ